MQKRQHKKIFWGILFLLGAVALLLGGLGHLGSFNFWSILFSIALLGCLVCTCFFFALGAKTAKKQLYIYDSLKKHLHSTRCCGNIAFAEMRFCHLKNTGKIIVLRTMAHCRCIS